MSRLKGIRDRLAEIKKKFAVWTTFIPDEDTEWLITEIERLRKAAHADQVVIQRLRRERDELKRITDIQVRGVVAENNVYSVAENKALELENRRLAALLALSQQRAASRAGRVPR